MIEFDGKDLDEALSAAAAAMGRPVGELDYELVEGGRKGVFGLGARPVRIRVRGELPIPPLERAPAAAPPVATPDDGGSAPKRTLLRMLRLMGFALEASESRRGGVLEIVLDGPDRKRLLAKDGELLTALEVVLSRMGRRAWPDDLSIRLTCPGFASDRDDDLVERVREAASEVTRSGDRRHLPAMNPYQRRIVHMTVREFPGLRTVSEGEGFLKRIRVEKIGS